MTTKAQRSRLEQEQRAGEAYEARNLTPAAESLLQQMYKHHRGVQPAGMTGALSCVVAKDGGYLWVGDTGFVEEIDDLDALADATDDGVRKLTKPFVEAMNRATKGRG
jgi:hypothetical protein